MAGTRAGGLKAAKTNIKTYGHDFYAKIGRKGGRNGHTGGFAADPELAKIAGAKGGKISKRGKAKNKPASSEPKGEHTAKKWHAEIENYERIYG